MRIELIVQYTFKPVKPRILNNKNLKMNHNRNYIVNTLKMIEELKLIALKNEGNPLEFVNDIEKKKLLII